jgi:leucyl-tRNA synthetase
MNNSLVGQINGKVCGDLIVASEASKDSILKAAKELPNVQKYLTGTIKKEIYVPGRLVSLVVG